MDDLSPVMCEDASPDPFENYSRALQLDEWSDDDSTPVRACAPVPR